MLGPAGGFGGLGEGAGRILELNVSVGQGLAIAAARPLQASGPQRGALDAVDPWLVAQRMQRLSPHGVTPYGRPTSGTLLEVLLRRLQDLIDRLTRQEFAEQQARGLIRDRSWRRNSSHRLASAPWLVPLCGAHRRGVSSLLSVR